MGKVNDGVMKSWKDGEIVYAADFVQEREMLRTAMNDNYERLVKKYEVHNADGTVKTTQNLDTAINFMNFKETAQIVLSLDTVTSTMTIGVVDGSITTAKLANLGVTTAKIADLNVTTVKLADLNVTNAKLADGSVNLLKMNLTDVDTRYYTKVKLDNGQLDNRYYTEGEIDNKLSNIAGGEAYSIRQGTAFPTSPLEGDVFYRTDTDLAYYYNGGTWIQLARQADLNAHTSDKNNPHGVTATQIGAEPSFTKNTGFNLNLGTASGTVAEGSHTHTASQVGAEKLIPKQTTAPTSPVNGDLWIDTSTNPHALKQSDGTVWNLVGGVADNSITPSKIDIGPTEFTAYSNINEYSTTSTAWTNTFSVTVGILQPADDTIGGITRYLVNLKNDSGSNTFYRGGLLMGYDDAGGSYQRNWTYHSFSSQSTYQNDLEQQFYVNSVVYGGKSPNIQFQMKVHAGTGFANGTRIYASRMAAPRR